MRISIFGLGYVGAVSAGCLAKEGHHVVGVDPNQDKVDLLADGKSPIIEQDLDILIAEGVREGRLRATTSAREAIEASDLSLICVGTPSQPNGSLELKYLERVCEEIGALLKGRERFHVVVSRSTVLPGTMRGVVIPTLEKASGGRAGVDFGVCNNPEFLREGSAIHDFYHPPKTVVGETDTKSGDLLLSLYAGLPGPTIRVPVEVAEMVKYADNTWHALKIGFANEIGNLCKAVGIDGHAVMDIFCQDEKLNIAPTYLKPGFAFGGSCLPKDVRALVYKGKSLDLELPILSAILPSNGLQVERGIKMVMERGSKKVGVLGFSFKAGTDDLRESPVVELIERLLGKGYDLKLYDRNVSLARLVGANRAYILNHIPHISDLMVEQLEDVLAHADTVVVGNGDPAFRDVLGGLRPGQHLVDLVRITGELPAAGDVYHGICW